MMSQYSYKMVQIGTGVITDAQNKDNAVADYLQKIVDREASSGWEFYRIDGLDVKVQPGCLAALFGRSDETIRYNVITFRRPAKE